MEKLKVQSTQMPETVEVFPTKDCFMRRNIEKVEDEYGEHFEYDEVFFISDLTKEEIESDFDAWYEFGQEWKPDEPKPVANWRERMEAQMTYTAIATKTYLKEGE